MTPRTSRLFVRPSCVLAVRRLGTTPLLAALAALMASAPAFAQFAYVPNGVDGTVSVINTASNMVTATIPLNLPGLFPAGVAVNSSGTRVYVTNTCDGGAIFGTTCVFGDPGAVSVIDTSTNQVIATIPVPNEPVGIAVTEEEVYVVNVCGACASSAGEQGSVSVIDVEAGSRTENKVVQKIPLPDVFSTGIVVDEDGSRAYVANLLDSATFTTSTVTVINTETHRVVGTIAVPLGAAGVVLNPNSPRLYVGSIGGGLSAIDTTNNTLINTNNSVGSFGLAIKPDGTRLYAADLVSSGLAVIDTTNDALNVVAEAPTGLPVGLSATPDGSSVYATITIDASGNINNQVAVVNTANNQVAGQITVGVGPTAFGQFIQPPCIEGLIDAITSVNSKAVIVSSSAGVVNSSAGIVNSQVATWNDAQAALAAKKAGRRQEAIAHLQSVVADVASLHTNHKLTDSEADHLTKMAGNIIAVLQVSLSTQSQHPAAIHVQIASRVVPAIQSLIEVTQGFNRRQGIRDSSDAKLRAVQNALAAAQARAAQSAINSLETFINGTHAQGGTRLTAGQASILTTSAQQIITMLRH